VLLQDLRIRQDVPTDAVELEIQYADPQSGEEHTRRFRSTIASLLASDPTNVRKALALMAWSDLLVVRSDDGDCTGKLDTFRRLAERVGPDKEIAFVSSLLPDVCAPRSFTMHQPPPRTSVTAR
jgi:hypothetical protein